MREQPASILTMTLPPVTFREYVYGSLPDRAAFRELNEAWIERFFAIEPKDRALFADPESKVLDAGGLIYFAIQQETPVGCCALIPLGVSEFEVAKMAVSESLRGRGIGRKLLSYVLAEADRRGIRRLYIETNHVLENAIHLYEAMGFRHLPAQPAAYARADVFMERLIDSERLTM